MSKPTCAYCEKPYGHRVYEFEEIVVEIGQPIPTSKRNTAPVKVEMFPPLPAPGMPDDPIGYVPMDAKGGSIFGAGNYVGRKGRRVRRSFWDGESYRSSYDPFCTLRCCELFAKASYKAGIRVVPKKEEGAA